jgi:hypothetical protein
MDSTHVTEQGGEVIVSCTCIRWCLIRTSAGKPAILTEVLGGLPESLQANFRIVPRGRQNRFHANTLKFIIHEQMIRRHTVHGY